MQAVVLAAGRGTRMGPLSAPMPKPLLPIADRPLVGHVLTSAAAAGATEFVVVTGYKGDTLRDRLGETYADTPVRYATQSDPDGTATAVASATEEVDGPFAVLNGDCLYRQRDLARLFDNGPAIAVCQVAEPSAYGIVSLEDNQVTDIIEKPTDPPSHFANAGAYVFPPESGDLFDVEQSDRGEYEVTDAVRSLAETQPVTAVEVQEWLDVGRPWELLAANETRLAREDRSIDGEVHSETTIDGTVVIEAGATVKRGVTIEGPAYVRSGSTIGPNAYVRGATLVGPDTKIGHAVEVKNSVLMAGATVPHLSYVGDSVIGRDVNLGAGTIVANLRHDREPVELSVKGQRVSTGREKFGAVIGHDVATGINTSINPGVTLSCGATTAPGETVTRDR